MEQREFLFRAIDLLEQAGIGYAVTGSWASMVYGDPRTTHDIDLIVALTVEQAQQLADAFPPPRYYADANWMREASALGEFFNIIDTQTGLKIDVWPLKNEPYPQEQFARRLRQNIAGRLIWTLTPEDVILSKLLWFKMSESQTQWRDIVGVWQAQKDKLDVDYLRGWAAQLSVGDLLNRITGPGILLTL